ncbi:flagellar basal-body MS-ring/collar protein FliF [Ammoniphilus resinae]|uniref:Flagellar M-ring protein n=1 Tax=Ammoniphilus resinae TaxID=861532 RepID=A0ABS4GKL6_9BACL|nr:flagellar basal-body MS-ring/collar protein FliF [Ammoniphilus resinae]MBP1930786.1 flagellar M-ring protein FliF [Ammoniphilus resinae]
MNQILLNLQETKDKFINYWRELGRKNKWIIIGTFLFVLITLSVFIFFVSRPHYIPLYSSELSQREVGDIKAALDGKGYTDYKLSPTGTQLLVPQKDAPDMLVFLASQGLPKNGSISYEVFSQNMTFGATDRQLDVIERDAMQNELAGLIKRVSGIKNAEVMITLPQESIFIQEGDKEAATASIVVETEPGQDLNQQQIRALYYLVSRSVPNLPIENIVIMDQYSELLELGDTNNGTQQLAEFEQQRKIKQNVERDIQRQLQQLLGTIMGQDKVLVHTFVSLNFDQIKSQENLVEPVNPENEDGIAISVEKISKTFKGDGKGPGGIDGTGEADVVQNVATTDGQSEYEELQNRVNYEVNRISRDITQSPYKIEDLTINVGVEPPNANDPASLTPETQNNIKNILTNVVRTALGNRPGLTDQDINNRISVFPRAFAGKEPVAEPSEPTPLWIYGAIAGAILLGVAAVLFIVLRSRKEKKRAEEMRIEAQDFVPPPVQMEPSQEDILRKNLENMAKQKPEEFVQLLRTWMIEERE